ncbi:MAG TPA: type II toxin-antitoxin system death-on-curing family toxin, partial [Phytomonospora sp.]
MTTRYLTGAQLGVVADLAVAGKVLVRDQGLLESAAERPRTALFGEPQFPGVLEQAAALFHSIARFHPLVDGNKRLSWTACAVLLELNGVRVTATDDEAYDLTIAVAS